MISIVIPTFNRPAATLASVRSVRGQEGLSQKIEIIVVDDASVAPLPAMLEESGVTVVRLSVNGGPAAARNAGVRASKGDFVAFLDSDDQWLDGKLAAQSAAYEKLGLGRRARETTVMCGGFYVCRRDGELEGRIPHDVADPGLLASGCWHSPGTTLFAHRSVFDRIGEFDESLRRLEDVDWFARLGLAGGVLRACPHLGAVILPSSAARPRDILAATEILRRKLRTGPLSALSARHRNKLTAYLYAEEALAMHADGRWLDAGLALTRSLARAPRWRLPVSRPWHRADGVPEFVRELLLEMKSERTDGRTNLARLDAGSTIE